MVNRKSAEGITPSADLPFTTYDSLLMRLVFMGTPAFAVPTLERLCADGLRPVAVVTSPDAPGRRGQPPQPSAVKAAAGRLGLSPVLTPDSVQEAAFAEAMRALGADLAVVVAFKILPPEVLAAFRLGALNLHGSLLPRYRGAAPIQRAVMAGETETGVTTFRLDAGVDTGVILLQARTPIGADETAGDVAERLMHLGADLVRDTVQGLEAGTLTPRAQDDALATRAPKLFRDEGRLDFAQPAQVLHNRVRGFSPAPGAHTTLPDGTGLKVYRTQLVEGQGPPGTVLEAGPRLVVACGDGALGLVEVQPEGRRRMDAAAFLAGSRLRPGEQMGSGDA
jgi:methionyl-tRNA formyltransferase